MAGSKLERLLNLTAALLDAHVPLTGEQIHRRVAGYPDDDASFRRQFERDKEALREQGVPIQVLDVPGRVPAISGYVIDPDEYYLGDPGLTPDELAALHLAARAVRIEGTGDLGALRKLGGSPRSAASPEGTAAELPALTLPTDDNLPVLFAASAARQVVRFTTHGTERDVEPHRLRFERGRWYLHGFDRRHEEVRHYRLDRIDGAVEPVGERGAFEHRETDEARLDPWSIAVEPAVEATLWLDATVAPTVLLEVGDAVVQERRPDGSMVVGMSVSNPDGFVGFVVGLLDHAEVLGPPDLREQVVAWLRACAEGAVR